MKLKKQILSRQKGASVALGILIACGVAAGLSVLLAAIGMKPGFLMGMLSLSYVALIVSAIVYASRFHTVRKNEKMLKRLGVTVEDCFEGAENAPQMPKSKIICADKALIFKKQKWVIPYSSVAWVYKQVVKAYGVVTTEVNMIVCTETGQTFKVTGVEDSEMVWLLHNYANRFSKDFVFGYGGVQMKKYDEVKKRNKKQGGKQS